MDGRNPADELQNITLAYVQGQEQGSGPTLEELMATYPQYANELIDFATNYYLSEQLPLDDEVAAAIEHDDLSRERRLLDDAFTQLRYPPALTSLLGRAGQRGYDAPALAAELDIELDVLTKLEQHVITDARPPLLERLARTLAVSFQQLQTFFAQPAPNAVSPGTFYYAEKPPAVGERQTFAEAIRTSRMMSAEQKDRWLATLGEPAGSDPATRIRNSSKHRRRG